MRWLLLSMMLLGLTACKESNPSSADWGYMVGSNADEIWHIKANFYRDGKPVHGSSSGAIRSVSTKSLQDNNYEWDIGKGRKGKNQPVPDKVVIEWVSFHDKKRYGITFDLPEDLGRQINQHYWVKVGKERREEQRNTIGLGLATGGYVEVFLTNPLPYLAPDILLVRGIAQEITNDPYDKRFPLHSQFKNAWARFDKEFTDAYLQHPTPSGMAWVPIMDAYRAAQPNTDQQPVH